MTAILVLGMGNPILSDDGVGLEVARRLRATSLPDGVEVAESESGGLRLLELVRGFTHVAIIDAVQGSGAPGEVLRFDAADFAGNHRTGSAHSIHVGTALELGRRLGYEMPDEVIVFGVEAEDVESFGETLSPSVANAADRAVSMVRDQVVRWCAA